MASASEQGEPRDTETPFAHVPDGFSEPPSALTYEGMNARVGSFRAGMASRRGGTRLAGQIIRAAVVLMLIGVVVGILVVVALGF